MPLHFFRSLRIILRKLVLMDIGAIRCMHCLTVLIHIGSAGGCDMGIVGVLWV